MNWNDYKQWCKDIKKYLKTPKPLLRKENVIDMDLGLIKDSKGNEYQMRFNTDGTPCGLRKVKNSNEK